jgi:hypothetical protein
VATAGPSETFDTFDRARSFAVALMIAAGLAAIVGSVLDWASIDTCPQVAEDIDFQGAEVEEPPPCETFRGVEILDGRVVIAAGAATIVFAYLLASRRSSGPAWLAFLASMVSGVVAISDYRTIGDVNSAVAERADLIGEASPGIGLTLVAVSALVGVIAAVIGVAASPHRD